MDTITIRQYTVYRDDDGKLSISAPDSDRLLPIESIEMEGRNLVIKMEHGHDIVFLNISKSEKRELDLIKN